MKKKLFTLALLGVVAVTAFGCGKKEEEATTTEATATEATTTEATTTEEVVTHEGEFYNELTGEWSDEEITTRPIAVMINNLKEALPSSSTKEADIYYECMVEGGITRLMPIYSSVEGLEKIGSVRSARHYYMVIADEFDAVYVHAGHSAPAEYQLNKGWLDHIDGLNYGGFFRDNSRVAPHNLYTTGEDIMEGITQYGYAEEYGSDHEPVFTFNEKDTDLADGQAASKVNVTFSSYAQPYFIYNEEKKVYERYQFNQPQIDNQADEEDNVLTVKNIIVQVAAYSCINASNDLQDIQQLGRGKGYYITNGKAIPITWEKLSHTLTTKYFTEDGEEIKLNPGKTWISIINNTEDASVSFE